MGDLSPNAIDLTTLDAVKNWAGVNNADSDDVIQAVITAFSQFVIDYTGVKSFTSVDQYIDVLDGNGSDIIFTRNRPIQLIRSVQVNGVDKPVSGGYNDPGCFVANNGSAVSFRNSAGGSSFTTQTYPGGSGLFSFTKGRGNIQITYTAGYQQVPFDLELTARRVCSINFKRTLWIDLVSKMQAVSGGQTTTMKFQNWALPPEDERVLMLYKRLALVG